MERIGVVLFRGALRLLPRWLRECSGDEMVAVFRERHRRARGLPGHLRAWGVEFGGVLVAAARARAPSAPSGASMTPSRSPGGALDALARDFRFALRSLARRPTVGVLAVATMALGIAASTAMFTVVDTVLLRPLPYPEPERIVALYPTNPDLEKLADQVEAAVRGTFSHPEYEDVARGSDAVLEAVALVIGWTGGILDGEGRPERIALGRTTPGLFSGVLRVNPLRGRTFLPEDEGTRVLVLTEGLWRRRFGGDPGIVGSTVSVSGEPHTVIGILPEGTNPARYDVEAWALFDGDENRGNHSYFALGRLRDGVSVERARAALSAVLTAADRAADDFHNHGGVSVFRLHGEQTRKVEGPLVLLAGAALLLLLVASGNVAALMVGAALDRERELAVRGALGAGRGRLIQQLLVESVIVAGAAGLAGIALAVGATDALLYIAPEDLPRIADVGVDARALAVAVGLSMGCGLLFGLIPALTFSRTNLRDALTSGGRTTGGRARLQAAVVVGELALATVLLVGAGLLGRTVLAMGDIDPGFDARRLLAVRLALPRGHLTGGIEDADDRLRAVDTYYRGLAEELKALPGVDDVALAGVLPLEGLMGNNSISPEGYVGPELVVSRRFVSGEYFDVTGIEIAEGRPLRPSDDRFDAPDPGVAVVSESLAERAWPGESAIGKRITYWGDRRVVVVGVARTVRDVMLDRTTELAFYVPMRQGRLASGGFLLRTDGDPAGLVRPVRSRIWEVDPDAAIPTAVPFTRFVRAQIASQRYRARLVAVFSVLAALFSLMGVYGVSARSVASRTRELGIRKALGARDRRVLGLVLRQALRLAILGAVAGLGASLVATRFVERYLWGVEPTDLLTLAGTAALLATASLLAALAPGRRAARIDPMDALRVE
ncbi:MAG: FtsX-like permease family protein [Gemmatimonadetes bacterium]|nr:ABC transporter permease [Gemmatimonadota bacterium]NIR81521.1 ABC transporter permease [Gemmatimonadota bacterium]NIT90366.1 ABC transporter permease [Gemmatimonadota bacterium]NIU34194.1 ABC transporter permease [Gemmatimonadota bacterium]NIU38337.1 FtsX-like permease family protein [Gemmatimonadota bacterium]